MSREQCHNVHIFWWRHMRRSLSIRACFACTFCVYRNLSYHIEQNEANATMSDSQAEDIIVNVNAFVYTTDVKTKACLSCIMMPCLPVIMWWHEPRSWRKYPGIFWPENQRILVPYNSVHYLCPTSNHQTFFNGISCSIDRHYQNSNHLKC